MSELNPHMRQAFAALAAESAVSPSAAFQARARAAMHSAVESRAARRTAWAPLRGLAGRRTAALGALATATASVLVAGWSAPTGSSLHPVRLVREQLTLALPGGDRAGRELGFAEDRLREATRAPDPSAALAEAASLLAAAGRDLHGGSGAQWGRWSRDEVQLRHADGTEPRGRGPSDPGHTEDGSGSGGTSPGGGSGGTGPNPLPAGGSSGGEGPHRGSASPTGQAGAPVGGGAGSPDGSGHHDGGAQPTAAATTSTSTSAAGSAGGPGRDGAGGGRGPGGGSAGRGGGDRSSTSTSTSSSGHGG
ncbi:MAG TPA: hypothetical protein VGP96_04890 [Candidatus Dormibacteraeota bacterium]|nr:hypothetical protein [Candidatus Dormibacteraeota bacterium]